MQSERVCLLAHSYDAPQEIIDTIERIPENEFGGAQDVMKGYGEIE